MASLLQDIQTLLRREADLRTGQLSVCPEVAAWLDAMPVAGGNLPAPVPGAAEEFKPASTLVAVQAPPVVAGSPTATSLEDLALLVSQCRLCGLCGTRTQTVFGSGNPKAQLVFVGEAPGEDEDLQGLPFVGRAGQLLTRIIENKTGMAMSREEVYICNVLKCRPPGNRNPAPEEMTACEPFLVRQLELLQPKVICALGGFAAKQLLKSDLPVGRLRGKWHFYHGIPVRVTYHPSYLLRLTGDAEKTEKNKVRDDVLALVRLLRGEETVV